MLALPANPEIGPDDRIELARSFAEAAFRVEGSGGAARRAFAAMARTARASARIITRICWSPRGGSRRRGSSAKKARDLDPVVRQGKGRAVVTEADAWGELWRDHQNRYFAEHGLDIRVDATSAVPQEHIGPIRMRAPEAEANARAEAIAQSERA